MRAIRKCLMSLCNAFATFGRETSLHGAKHIVNENLHVTERSFWMVLLVSAITGTALCTLVQIDRYNTQPTVMSLQIDYREWWTYNPAITVCYQDRVDKVKTGFIIKRLWNVTREMPELYTLYESFIQVLTDVSFRNNVHYFWSYDNDHSFDGVDLLQLAIDLHPELDLKTIISTDSKAMNVTWRQVVTEMGICYTMNSQFSIYQAVDRDEDVTTDGDNMSKCHYNSAECFIKVTSERVIRFFVHSPRDIADAISNPTGFIYPGESVEIDYKILEIKSKDDVKRLSLSQRRCHYTDEPISDQIPAYSHGLCQMNCRIKMSNLFCGCHAYFHNVKGGKPCDALGMGCIARNSELLINLPKNLINCSCLPPCDQITYNAHFKKTFIGEASNETSVASLMINLKPPKTRLYREIIFSYQDLLISLGGTSSLFLGASILTFVEICVFIIKLTVNSISKHNNS